MGFQELHIKIQTAYSTKELRKLISKKLRIQNFEFEVISKGLDARNKRNIHWQMRIRVSSPELSGELDSQKHLDLPYKKREQKVIVVGSGPAGFFAAFFLQQLGYDVLLIERGTDVDKRTEGIDKFESTGKFDALSNYAFGEGGAGTFSDGKLTSRSKHISLEKRFILQL